VGSEAQKIAYMQTLQENTDILLSMRRDLAGRNPTFTNLAISMVVQRQGRVLETLVNAASQSPNDPVCSAGSVASLQGQWLNDAGVPQVSVNGTQVPLVSTGSTRIDFICPEGAPGTELQVRLENAAGVYFPNGTTAAG
jgi:hypothetical protein